MLLRCTGEMARSSPAHDSDLTTNSDSDTTAPVPDIQPVPLESEVTSELHIAQHLVDQCIAGYMWDNRHKLEKLRGAISRFKPRKVAFATIDNMNPAAIIKLRQDVSVEMDTKGLIGLDTSLRPMRAVQAIQHTNDRLAVDNVLHANRLLISPVQKKSRYR